MATYLANGIPIKTSKIQFIKRIDNTTILIKTKKDEHKVSFNSKAEADEDWEFLARHLEASKTWIIFLIVGNVLGGIIAGQFLYHWLKPYLF